MTRYEHFWRPSRCEIISHSWIRSGDCLYSPFQLYDASEAAAVKNGSVVRALASHQCGPGSIPDLGVICGLSLLLVLVPAPRVFLRVLRFSSLRKKQHFQIPYSTWKQWSKSHSVDSTEIPIYLFIFFIYLQTDYLPIRTCLCSGAKQQRLKLVTSQIT